MVCKEKNYSGLIFFYYNPEHHDLIKKCLQISESTQVWPNNYMHSEVVIQVQHKNIFGHSCMLSNKTCRYILDKLRSGMTC